MIDNGKSSWVKLRGAEVSAKGKGLMQTYWLVLKRKQFYKNKPKRSYRNTKAPVQHSDTISELSDMMESASFSMVSESSFDDDELLSEGGNSKRDDRLIDWNVEVLAGQLKKIIAMRGSHTNSSRSGTTRPPSFKKRSKKKVLNATKKDGTKTVLDEVKDKISHRKR